MSKTLEAVIKNLEKQLQEDIHNCEYHSNRMKSYETQIIDTKETINELKEIIKCR